MGPKDEGGLAVKTALAEEGGELAASAAPLLGSFGLPAVVLGCGCLVIFLIFGGIVAVGAFGLNNADQNSQTATGPDSVGGSTPGATIPGTVTTLTISGKEVIIPATKGKVGSEGATSGLAFSCSSAEIKYYITMRWPFAKWAWSGQNVSYDNTSSLYKHKKVVVYNPRSKKTVIAPICESGPAPWTGSSWRNNLSASIRSSISSIYQEAKKNPPSYWRGYVRFDPPEADGRVAGLAPAAADAIDAREDDVLQYGFAADQNIAIGPVK